MRALVLLVALLIGLSAPAGTADDVAAAQRVIRSQVEAFGRDDAATAYSHAALVLPDAAAWSGRSLTLSTGRRDMHGHFVHSE